MSAPRVAIAATHCSLFQGGEAAIPFHCFRLLRERGVDARLVTHARHARELALSLPHETGRIHTVPDSGWDRLLRVVGRRLPERLDLATTSALGFLHTQHRQRALLRDLIAAGLVDIVHQPMPVSPRQPSLLTGLGVPVVIGPMNGAMDHPPGLRAREGLVDRAARAAARLLAGPLNALFRGKHEAAALIVANARTRAALPVSAARLVHEVPENGVDRARWQPAARRPDGVVRFLAVGRLVRWKGIDLLLEAWARSAPSLRATLDIIGDGPEAGALRAQARRLRLSDAVRFHGWQPQPECARRLAEGDVLVMPSLLECGGAVVLEAMACALPVVAIAWGGPAEYVDATCGVLVEPTSHRAVVDGLGAGMRLLHDDAALRRRLGAAARERALRLYDWERKINRFLDIYAAALGRRGAPRGARGAVAA